jgi:hypothetical protein
VVVFDTAIKAPIEAVGYTIQDGIFSVLASTQGF